MLPHGPRFRRRDTRLDSFHQHLVGDGTSHGAYCVLLIGVQGAVEPTAGYEGDAEPLKELVPREQEQSWERCDSCQSFDRYGVTEIRERYRIDETFRTGCLH